MHKEYYDIINEAFISPELMLESNSDEHDQILI